MPNPRRSLLGRTLVVAASSAALLGIQPAPAGAAAFLMVETETFYGSSAGGCNELGTMPAPSSAPLVENGAAITSPWNVTSTLRNQLDPADEVTTKLRGSATTRVRSAGGRPREVSTTFAGSYSVTSTKPDSACETDVWARTSTRAAFQLASPMWATIEQSTSGRAANVAVYVGSYTDGGNTVFFSNLAGERRATQLLTPGDYEVGLDHQFVTTSEMPTAGSIKGRSVITFAPIGDRVSGPVGAAKKQVKLPAAITCSTGKARVQLTKKKAQLKKVRAIVVKSNSTSAKLKGKGLKKGRTLSLRVPASAHGTVSATVTLKGGRKQTVRASYLPCSD